MLTLSEAGLKAALKLRLEQVEFQDKSLRVYLEGKGCDGFTYGVTFDTQQPDDTVFPHDGLAVVCDPQSLPFLTGSVIEWVDDERGRGFLVENPNHRKFRGKFFKRSNWQDRLFQ